VSQLSSGMVGLVVGAVLGLVLTVLFEENLKNLRGAAVALVQKARARGILPTPVAEFRLGPLQTAVLIVEGDGQQVIDEQAVRVVVDPSEVSLPDDVALVREEVSEQQDSRRRKGLQAHWNGPSYAVTGLSIDRSGIDESPGACLHLRSTDYFTFLATQQLDRELPDGHTLRTKYLDPYPPTRPPDFMSASFGTYVAVITADDMVVFAKRSTDVGAFPGRWDASTNEALSRSIDSHGRTPPNLYDVARRGLHEELGLGQSEYRLELLAFNIDRSTNQWGSMFAAFLQDLTSTDVADRRTRGVADKWEHDQIDFVRFTIDDVIGYLLRSDRRHCWTPVAPALYYLTLARRYGRSKVERQAARTIRTWTSH
jgi:hypothetical protein